MGSEIFFLGVVVKAGMKFILANKPEKNDGSVKNSKLVVT